MSNRDVSMATIDVVLPGQFVDIWKGKGGSPERRLAVAVLADAVDCYQKHLFSRDANGRQLFNDADRWISLQKSSWPFSFCNLCEELDINPEYLYQRLQRWRKSALREARQIHIREGSASLRRSILSASG